MSARVPLSVLLPVRDGAAHLPEAIASLEAQSFADYEVIAVDDGSTDGTLELLADWAARDRRVRVLTQPAEGIVPALERARREAAGRLLARMDADDLSKPDRFARQVERLERDPGVALLGCLTRYFPDEAVRDGARRYEDWLNATLTHEQIEREIFVECPLAHPTFCMRADLLESVGGYRDVGWPEDFDLVLRVWRAGGRFAKVGEVLLHWRERPERLSRTHPRYGPKAFLACKTHHLLGAFPGARDGVVVWGAGPVGKALARALLSEGVRLDGFAEVDPRKIGQEIHGALVLDAPGALERRGSLHLGAVGQPGARDEVRRTLSGAGFHELENFVLMA
jgi:glycosyltransferase involved in cell wall biosynthesis